jgi:hypothetical protein
LAKVNLVTPIGVARFPKISQPDTTGQYADNKYKTDVVFSDADTKALKAQIVAFAKKELSSVNEPQLPIKEAKDKETGEVVTFVRFKSKTKPMIIDAKKNRVPADVTIGGGSKVRIGATMSTYAKGPNKGVTLYLNAVQVVELHAGVSINDFDEYDGEDAFEVQSSDSQGTSEFDL